MKLRTQTFRGPWRQRGLVAVIMVVVLLSMVGGMVLTSLSMSGSGGYDTVAQNDAVEAVFLAESGIQRAGRLYNQTPTTACNDGNLNAGTWHNFGTRGRFRVAQTFTTDFTGAPFPSANWCRVQAQGEITGTQKIRTIEGIFERTTGNIFPPSSNPNFNEVPWTGTPPGPAPNNWTITVTATDGLPFSPWDPSGGPDLSRSAFVRKTNAGGGTSTTGGNFTFSPVINIPSATTMTLKFSYRVWTSEGSSSGMELILSLVDTNGNSYTSTPSPFYSGNTVTSPQLPDNQWPAAGCGSANCMTPQIIPSGLNGYRCWNPPHSGCGAVGGSVSFALPGGIAINKINYALNAKSGRPKWIWVDDLQLEPPGGAAATVELRKWREIVTLQ